jgi:hypothetical protein
MWMKLDQKKGKGFVYYWCELVPIYTKVVQQFEHNLKTGRSQKTHAITTTTLHYG